MRLLLLSLLASVAMSENANCQCITSYPTGVSPSDGVTIGGQNYFYSTTYGLSSCATHDSGLPPVCNAATNVPAWCSNSWCYVDRNACSLPTTASSYFPGTTLYYSYTTCGSANTFTSWFSTEAGSGLNGGDGQTHVAGDLVGVIHDYLISLSNTLEDNEPELRSASTCTSAPASSCPCTTCRNDTAEATFWTNTSWTPSTIPSGASTLSYDHSTVSLTPRGNPTSGDAVIEQCLSGFLENGFMRVAAREAAIDQRVGFEYAGFQALGNYVQWPATEWCTTSYDPRFRSWYVSAASGPKDVVIVLDKSGSMSQQSRMEIMVRAAHRLLNTFTEADYIGMVAFSSGADAALSETRLLRATDENKARFAAWIDTLTPGGTTNFVDAFDRAFTLLRGSHGQGYLHSSGCTKAILFLSDGEPNPTPTAASIREQADALGGVKIFTYALGSGARTDVLKEMSCQNSGALWQVSDGGNLGDAMADYYTFLAPMQAPCQVRWTHYNDWSSGVPLLAACLATFKKDTPALATSCAGGTANCMPELLGVACMDVSVIATQEMIRARSDAAGFFARVETDQRACSTVSASDAQLQALRARVTFGDAVCTAAEMGVETAPQASSCASGGGGGGGGATTSPSAPPGGVLAQSEESASSGPVFAMIGGVAALAMCLCLGCYFWSKLARPKPTAFPDRNPHTQMSTSSQPYPTQPAYGGYPQQPAVQAQVVQAVPMGQPVQPYGQGIAMATPVA